LGTGNTGENCRAHGPLQGAWSSVSTLQYILFCVRNMRTIFYAAAIIAIEL
jgi:hypothetical protein